MWKRFFLSYDWGQYTVLTQDCTYKWVISSMNGRFPVFVEVLVRAALFLVHWLVFLPADGFLKAVRCPSRDVTMDGLKLPVSLRNICVFLLLCSSFNADQLSMLVLCLRNSGASVRFPMSLIAQILSACWLFKICWWMLPDL